MKYLLSKENLAVLKNISPKNTLIAMDFDGTITRIVKTPSDVALSHKTEELLFHLSKNFYTAVISGRSLSDLKKLIPIPSIFLVGNHGMEGLPETQMDLKTCQNLCTSWKVQLTQYLKETVGES